MKGFRLERRAWGGEKRERGERRVPKGKTRSKNRACRMVWRRSPYRNRLRKNSRERPAARRPTLAPLPTPGSMEAWPANPHEREQPHVLPGIRTALGSRIPAAPRSCTMGLWFGPP
eukprot:scaffold200406_cov32-Tisochrysis_lutea.AAC.5